MTFVDRFGGAEGGRPGNIDERANGDHGKFSKLAENFQRIIFKI